MPAFLKNWLALFEPFSLGALVIAGIVIFICIGVGLTLYKMAIGAANTAISRRRSASAGGDDQPSSDGNDSALYAGPEGHALLSHEIAHGLRDAPEGHSALFDNHDGHGGHGYGDRDDGGLFGHDHGGYGHGDGSVNTLEDFVAGYDIDSPGGGYGDWGSDTDDGGDWSSGADDGGDDGGDGFD